MRGHYHKTGDGLMQHYVKNLKHLKHFVNLRQRAADLPRGSTVSD